MAAVNIELTEGQIRDAVAVALAEAFSDEQRQRLILDVVRAHLQARERDYDRETILAKRAGEMIREIAKEELSLQLETMRPRVRAALRTWMGKEWEDAILLNLTAELKKIIVRGVKVIVDCDVAENE